jgi:uncharacterized membrane protein
MKRSAKPRSVSANQPAQRSDTFIASARFSGPLPPPAILAQYNNAVPNAAERILKMAEKEQSHAHAFSYFAYIIGALSFVALLTTIILTIAKNYPLAAAAIATLAAVCLAFIRLKHRK